MLGGLYGDLPPPSTDDEEKSGSAARNAPVWSNSAKMAPSALRKPTTLFTPPPSVLRRAQTSSSSSSHSKPTSSSVIPIANLHDEVATGVKTSSFQPALVGVPTTVNNEYDPARPNDYEDYRREKKRKLLEAEMKRDLERRRREEEEREKEQREAAERERSRDYETRTSALNISGEEAWKRRAAMSGGGVPPRSPSPPPTGEGFSIGKSASGGLGVGAGGQMTAAQRMMAKMGWKKGQGLGKQEQGITTPLMAKKTDRRAGVIVNASDSAKSETKKPKSVSFNGTPTRVLLLRNMVGPGEVDDELEDEVASECAKYGTVTRVLIFEITEPNFPAEEAVRIFVQFERSEETTKALIDLDSRFFGGRVVRALFYDEGRFAANELAPSPGEIPGFS
ncbi:Splicing factor 45 [Zostera marina]|uniref:Splicing factor 45 n=1 Tax=Zostera marina TaxID=29655 RepID=A0A0K9NN59_ZOSMR|nr:Splicing factor 45 [Zostera marina]